MRIDDTLYMRDHESGKTILPSNVQVCLDGFVETEQRNMTAAVQTFFRGVGHSLNSTDSMPIHSLDGQSNYTMKVYPSIEEISHSTGYATGGQTLTLTGTSLDGDNVSVIVDGEICEVKTIEKEQIVCVTKSKDMTSPATNQDSSSSGTDNSGADTSGSSTGTSGGTGGGRRMQDTSGGASSGTGTSGDTGTGDSSAGTDSSGSTDTGTSTSTDTSGGTDSSTDTGTSTSTDTSGGTDSSGSTDTSGSTDSSGSTGSSGDPDSSDTSTDTSTDTGSSEPEPVVCPAPAKPYFVGQQGLSRYEFHDT